MVASSLIFIFRITHFGIRILNLEWGFISLLLPRGLRTHRYHCVALKGFKVSQLSKPSQPYKPYFPRGLRTHRYHCFALKGFKVSQPSKPSQPYKPYFPFLSFQYEMYIISVIEVQLPRIFVYGSL